MKMNWMVAGAVTGFVGVALGAFGAHGLEGRVGEEAIDWWRTGVLYHLVHAPVLVLLGLLALHGKAVPSAGWAFLLGISIFSGTLYAMALGAPRWLGAVTPIGGLLLLGGWALLARGGRRSPLVVVLLLVSALSACRRSPSETITPPGANLEDPTMEKIEKTDAEWRALLTDEQYRITRQGGTERANTGQYTDTTTEGFYKCVCCGLPLFKSDAKFHSGCGWPSFFQPLEGFHITELRDTSHGMVRTEVRCKRCDAHLGHVFEDGPAPTGLRYCINSAAIELVPDE